MEPVVSLIMPFYNRISVLEETINSILKQTYQYWELIIVDDGSHEKQFEQLTVFEKQSRISIYKRKGNNKGPSACRNEAVQHAKGKYLIFIDSDDTLHKDCLLNRVGKMDTNPQSDIGLFNIKKFYLQPEDTNELFSVKHSSRLQYLLAFLSLQIPWQVMGCIWKKETFEKTGGFNECMNYAEDPEMHVRALLESSISISFYHDEPADCYYRMPSKDHVTSSDDLQRSIKGRIFYIKSAYEVCKQNSLLNSPQKRMYKKAFKKGYSNIFSYFINDSDQIFKKEFEDVSSFFLKESVITRLQYVYCKWIFNQWSVKTSKNNLLPVKAIATKIYYSLWS
jgi:glycosyltransferase involved in cell wall biosynthesis